MKNETTYACGLRLSAPPDHELKIWPDCFEAILFGGKNFELRRNDRDFKPRDSADLREWDPATQEYTGRAVRITIGYILYGSGTQGLADGWCIFAIERPVVHPLKGATR